MLDKISDRLKEFDGIRGSTEKKQLVKIASIASEITKTAEALNVSTERTVFLTVGSFYICQFQANITTLETALINAAASINKAPQPPLQ